jgi:DNA-binding IclR family transcriptional regulator
MAGNTCPRRRCSKMSARSRGPHLTPTLSAPRGGEGVRGGRGGIQSLERGFALLEEIARHRDGIGLAALARRVGLHTSTAFHLVKTLMALGYVDQVAESRRYRLGRQVFSLAAGALDEIELKSLATPALQRLARATGETSHFAVRAGARIVVLAKTAGSGMFPMADQVGVERPAHATALGKVLLAAMPPDELERYLATTRRERLTGKTIVDAEPLGRELAEVAESGIALDDGEFDAEARCVAVPVHDFTGAVVGALGISGPVWRLSMAILRSKTETVRKAAAELSRALGYARKSPSPLEGEGREGGRGRRASSADVGNER